MKRRPNVERLDRSSRAAASRAARVRRSTSTSFEDEARGAPQAYEYAAPATSRTSPAAASTRRRWRSSSRRASTVSSACGRRPGGPDRGERHALALRSVRLPGGFAGLLTTGGSMANLSAMVTARHAKLGRGLPRRHVLRERAGARERHEGGHDRRLLARNLRIVPTDAELRMDPAGAAPRRSRADRRAGLRPFLVVPAAGTTNTGAIDPLDDVADIAADEGLWMHVDAAYGGFFQLTDRGRVVVPRASSAADSVTLDPHKGLFLPYGTGGARRARRRVAPRGPLRGGRLPAGPAALRRAARTTPSTRPSSRATCRGLRVWFPLRLHGVGAFREALDEKLDLAAYLRRRSARRPERRALLGAAAHRRAVPARGRGRRGRHRAAEASSHRINASKRVFLSSTMIHGRYVLRACIVSHRTHRTASTSASRSCARPRPSSPGPEGIVVPEMPEMPALAERLDEVLAGAASRGASTSCSSRR